MIRYALPLLLLATPAMATPFQDTAALDHSIAAFTGHAIGEEGGARAAIDARLRLALCPTVALSWRTPAHDAVVATCAAPTWRIFIAVRNAVTITPAATATATVAAAPVKLEPVIRRGDPVTIEAGSPGFSITREGIAMGDAAPGARFMVKCDDAKGPVQAVAIEAGHATLPGWENKS
jgi:flagellar basal body P-ring formation protein FlgA